MIDVAVASIWKRHHFSVGEFVAVIIAFALLYDRYRMFESFATSNVDLLILCCTNGNNRLQ